LTDSKQAGVVERTASPPPIARTVYTLSHNGWRFVLPILGAVERFGLQKMRFSSEESRSPPNGLLVGMLLDFESAGAAGVEATYRVQIDGRNFDFAVTAGRLAGAARARCDLERIGIRPGDRAIRHSCDAAYSRSASPTLSRQR
jgi:hypothetical protein